MMCRLAFTTWILLLLLLSTVVAKSQSENPLELRVTEVLPAPDTQNIQSDTSITVIFNRPVVPLVIAEQQTDLPQPLTFSPSISGQGEWLDTSVYVFHPDDHLRPGIAYAVTVQDSLKAINGAQMNAPYQWSFTTNLPQVTRFITTYDTAALRDQNIVPPPVQVFGENEPRALRDPLLLVYFNQDVDHESFESRFYLHADDDPLTDHPGTFEWDESNAIVRFRPNERLDYSTTYQAGLNLTPDEASFSGETQWSFRTVDRPAFVANTPKDGEKSVQTGGISLYFPGPMDEDSFDGKITIEPEPEQRTDYYQYNNFSVAFPMRPSTTYTITVAPGLKDIYGTVLDEGLTFSFITAPINPNFALNVPNYFGFYNASNEQMGFYVNHVNVNLLTVKLYDVRLEGIIDMLAGYTPPYQPLPIFSAAPPTLPYETHLRDNRIQFLPDPLNQFYPQFLNLGEDGPLPPGIYSAHLNASVLNSHQLRTSHLLMVMNANLTLKTSPDHAWVWATDVNSGAPLPNAPIQIYGKDHQLQASGRTNAHGMLEANLQAVNNMLFDGVRVAVLQSDDYFGLTSSNMADGIDPGWFNEEIAFYPDQYRFYSYTDRPVYRPGQPVYFRAVLRTKDDMAYSIPKMSSAPVQIVDSKGNTVLSKELPLTPFGTISGEFQLSADAPLGYYRVTVMMPADSNHPDGAESSTGFSVAEYHLPEFQASVVPQAEEVVDGDLIHMNVNAAYFSGGALGNAQVNYSVISAPAAFHYTGPGHYSFYDYGFYDQPDRSSKEIAEDTGETDRDGTFQLELPADLSERPFTQRYQVEATVLNENGQTVSARTSILVHPGLLYLGTHPEHNINNAGKEAAVNLIAVDWDSQPIAHQDVDVSVVEQRWQNVQEVDPLGRKTWTWHIEEIPFTDGHLTTGADGKGVFRFTPSKAGVYAVRLTTHDSDGHLIKTASTLWVSGSEYVSWQQQNNNRIELIADQETFAVGETAEIMIASPFQGSAQALITVERAGVMKTEQVTMNSNSYVYRLPIEADYAPNIFVSVMLVKSVDEHNPVAAFRMGLIQLQVDTGQKQIHVEITADHTEAQPGDTVRYTLRTTDYEGHPVQAEVGVGLTDLAALSLADAPEASLLDYFYRLQGIGVRTSTPLTVNADQLNQQALDVLKGGGGGGGMLGVIEVRENFVDTPYWNAALVTDSAGEATFEVTLPDNLTTWRVDARAITKGEDGVMLVGQNTYDLVSTRPLIIRPVTPRFFVVDDQVSLGALVNNNTDQPMTAKVSLQSTGLTIEDALEQTVTVPARGQTLVRWAATVSAVEQVEAVFYADAGEYTDAARPALGEGDDHLLPVYRYEAQETVANAGILRGGDRITEGIQLPDDMHVTRGQLDIHLEPSLAVTTVAGLDYLQNYPYLCIEQIVSRFLPNIMTYRALAELGLNASVLKVRLDANVNDALQRLYKQQKSDGGWGWFENEPSNKLTTAYALLGLTEALKQGYEVTGDVIIRAQNYLRTTFVVPELSTPTWELNRQAFVLYALARSGVPDVARAANLFDIHDRLNLDARAFLALTFHYANATDTRAETLLSDLLNKSSQSATGTYWSEDYGDYWNWTTDTRTSAIVLEVLTQMRPQSALIPNVVRWLITQRKTWHWETTQETAWAVMALTDWMKLTGELKPDYTYTVSMNGATLTQGKATPTNLTQPIDLSLQVNDLLKDQMNHLLIERDDGAGVLYYTEQLRVWLPVPQIDSLDRGIILQRRYTLPGDTAPLDSAKVGDIIQVHLTVIAPSDLYYATIEDPIPAGTEAIDPGLKISQQYGTQPGLDRVDLSRGWGWWWFSHIEFHDEKVVLSSGFLPAGTYEYTYNLRAAVPGTYNVIPATGQETYFPEVYGRSAGSQFTILPTTAK